MSQPLIHPASLNMPVASTIGQGYPGQYYNVQNNLPPLPVKRLLTAEEELLKQKGLSQWTGEWFPHLGTELWQLMSDPKKQASLWGHVTGVAAGMIGAATANLGHIMHPNLSHTWAPIAVSSLLGLPMALMAYYGAKQNNGNLSDMWPRLPERPTYRDYLSDAVASSIAPIRATQAKDILPTALNAAATASAATGLLGNARSRKLVSQLVG
jgi:hypothetical protein